MFKNFTKYEVYDDGRIWSYKSNKFLKPSTNNKGYKQVNLYDNEGKMKCYFVHRIVYESVTGEPIPENLECNHIDEDKTNCSFANLNLMSRKENMNWGTRTERAAKARINGVRSKAVGAYRNGELVFTFPSTREAGRNGFDQRNVSKCCRNCFHRVGNNVYKGYEWRFI